MSEDIKIPYELPEGWKWCRLGDVCKFENGYAFKADKFSKTGIPVIRITNIKENEIDLSDCIHSSETNIDDKFLVRKGDLLIAMSGATTGKNGVYLSEEKVYLNQRVGNIKVIDNKILNDKFRNFYIQEKEQEILRNAYGGAQPNISSNKICEMLFPLPPTLEEQQRIVNRIETLFAKLDQAKEKAQNVVDTFETRKASILHKAFTGELTKKWREENGVGDDSWERKQLEKVCEKIVCGKTPTGFITKTGEVPYLKVYNIVNNKIDFDTTPQFIPKTINEGKLSSSILKPFDVVMNIVGPPLRKIAIIPDTYLEWNMNQAIVRFRVKDSLNYKYLYYGLINPETLSSVVEETRGVVGQQNISVSQSRELELNIPTYTEQIEIVRILDAILEKESKAKKAAEAVLEQIDLLKKSILARAFRGEI